VKKRINDGLSRQHRWQIKKKKQGLCIICGKPKVTTQFCLAHAIKTRERQRKVSGSVERCYGSKTYVIEKKQKEQSNV
jgi:hypothetical protein